jgi:hypothetical protein
VFVLAQTVNPVTAALIVGFCTEHQREASVLG